MDGGAEIDVARPGRGPVDADGIARRPPAAPMEQPSLGIRTEREGAHASTGGSPAERGSLGIRGREREKVLLWWVKSRLNNKVEEKDSPV